MPESDQIRIVHVSDLHAKHDDFEETQLRLDALIHDLQSIGGNYDCLVISGDIANSGDPREYDIALNKFINPLLEILRIPNKNVIIVPGNHDVSRSSIDPYTEAGMRNSAVNSTEAFKLLNHETGTVPRLKAFYDWAVKNFPSCRQPYSTTTLHLKGFDVAFALLNSAWRCSSDKDAGALFITEEQVIACTKDIQSAGLKIAVVHHPFDWYHPTEDLVTIPDIKHRFDMLLTGHIHKNRSTLEISATTDFLQFTAPAISDGKEQVGYHIYEIDLDERKLRTQFRTFIRERREFDANTQHARGGLAEFNLPHTSLVPAARHVLVKRLDTTSNDLEQTLRDKLQQFQQVTEPLYVSPEITESELKDGKRIGKRIIKDLRDDLQNLTVLYGPSECGKSIFLHALGSELNRQSREQSTNNIAAYVDIRDYKDLKPEKAIRQARNSALVGLNDDELGKVTLLIDHLPIRSTSDFDLITGLLTEWQNTRIVLTIASDLVFDIFIASASEADTLCCEMHYWGPSRIKQLSERYFSTTEVDVDAAFKFVSDCLGQTDLPSSPIIVTLFLSVFPVMKDSLSSISFLRLIEKYEQLRFGEKETSPANELYNRRRVLALVAVHMIENDAISIDRESFDAILRKFFEVKHIPFDSNRVISGFIDSGMIMESQGMYEFRCFAFMDYYIARAIEFSFISVEDLAKDLGSAVRVGDALAFYGGLYRENETLAERLIVFIEEQFRGEPDFDLPMLDQFIQEMLYPKVLLADAEKEANDVANRADDEVRRDKAYQESKSHYVQQRRETAVNSDVFQKADEIGKLVRSLEVFYNVFRNLENLDGDVKIKLIDRILNYQIEFNLRLIVLFHSLLEKRKVESLSAMKSAFAFVVTISTQEFMSRRIKSHSLGKALLANYNDSQNSMKQLINLFMLIELRWEGFEDITTQFLANTKSRAAVELLFMKVRLDLIFGKGANIPPDLLVLFKAVVKRRIDLNPGDSAGKKHDRIIGEAVADLTQQKKMINQRSILLDRMGT